MLLWGQGAALLRQLVEGMLGNGVLTATDDGSVQRRLMVRFRNIPFRCPIHMLRASGSKYMRGGGGVLLLLGRSGSINCLPLHALSFGICQLWLKLIFLSV